jgi:hypothetical protein
VQQASAAVSGISKVHYSREIAPKPLPPNGFLYHYTTAQGLKGIIEKNELWATSAYFLNDSTEIVYGCRVLKEALEEWMARDQRGEESLSLGLARQLKDVFGEHLLNMKLVQPIFLCCFCENDNVLNQWIAYGKSSGYSFGFQVPTVREGFRPEPNTCTSQWVKVEYDKGEQLKSCRTILDSILAIFDDEGIARAISAIGAHPLFGYNKIFRIIVDMLIEEIVSFKNEAFKGENEWRVVVRQREWVKQGTDDGSSVVKPVHFRCSSSGALIPYVRLIPSNEGGKLPIACVRSGPTKDTITTDLAVSLLLQENGFSVPIRRSDIPLRP